MDRSALAKLKRPLLRQLDLLDTAIGYLEAFLLSLSVLLMAALNIANVISRNLFESSFTYATELNQLLIVLITFLGIGYGARKARHIRMSALTEQLRGRWAKALFVVSQLGTALLLFTLAWFAFDYVTGINRRTPALDLPIWAIYSAAPIGFVLGGIQFLLAAIRNLTTAGSHLAFKVPAARQADHDSPV